ncbi:amino acid ABC transporter ATP-binding protein [Alpinimonas psychrophila]|uniref:Polar amino acid transport system ATP-binding protein n=1 Tax=Alpinimonas psychrophila TaxID=748908 RepID=A0A7W3JUM2_9MICO|nr:amino acid ABC transporter ATP-binding protein [Alpinimonas psychrophila]MBA8829559.1 polar amino acid transport system ATP-binding protein [Alpinimonas psychrophila]
MSLDKPVAPDRSENESTPTLQVKNLHKAYNGNEVLKGVEFAINRGQVKAILGPSGSGKSTMLRLMALLEPADDGAVFLDGLQIGTSNSKGKTIHHSEGKLAVERRDIGMVFQRFNLFPHLSALDNVALALISVQSIKRSDARETAFRLLERVGLADRASHFPSELSGGQQQRVAIARALVLKPHVMLFDEPTSALDPELVGEVLEVMEDLAASGMTMIVVTHETRFARRVANEVTLFDSGVIVEQAEPNEFFENPQHERTKRFLSHVH